MHTVKLSRHGSGPQR